MGVSSGSAGVRLAAFLAWSELSQEELAQRIGVHQTYVGRLIRGVRGCSLAAALRIEDVTATFRRDGLLWEPGPLRAVEWTAGEVEAETETAKSA